jgi:membrane-associated phospholipid phosphatase
VWPAGKYEVPIMKRRCVLGFVLLAWLAVPVAHAGDHQTWRNVSDVGVAALLVSSLAVPAAKQDWQGFREAAFSDALGEGFALAGKALVHEERPNHKDNNSFPSGHSALAFAAATTLYRRYGWEYGYPAYGVAIVTGYARVAAREHHWWDVVASAVFSTGAAWLVTHPINSHVEMTPWVSDKGGGIAMVVRW